MIDLFVLLSAFYKTNAMRFFILGWFLVSVSLVNAQIKLNTDVLVIGGGTGGTTAGIQSARSGANTIIVESTPWLGGMLSAAGVSATDGNDKLYSGIWQQFREALYKHYHTQNLATGWVSNTLFEPHVADSIFKAWAVAEKRLQVKFNYHLMNVLHNGPDIQGAEFENTNGEKLTILAKVIIDATELGDAMAMAGVPFDVGMEADSLTKENAGVLKSSNIIQDLTYAAILKDYGKGADKTIEKPAGYDPQEFDGSCLDYYHNTKIEDPKINAVKMLEYAKLPHDKYMLNWPRRGNDTYLDVIDLNYEERQNKLNIAKQTTLRFIYFIQQQLGFKNLGLANDEYKTADKLPYIPYYREGRRVHGLVRFSYRNIAEPFTYGDPLYRTGISVGDYPIDHHHKKNVVAPQHLSFYPIPSFNVPLGALIPAGFQNLIIAEKGISVSNIVNGTTRLQPCVFLTGQAAGMLASEVIKQKKQPASINVRTVQQDLLDNNVYIMPYIDVKPGMPFFQSIQRIGATGILKGLCKSVAWANQTWFYPDSLCSTKNLFEGLKEFHAAFRSQQMSFKEEFVNASELSVMLAGIDLKGNDKKNVSGNLLKQMKASWSLWKLNNFSAERSLTRAECAVLIDHLLNPFANPIDHKGRYILN